MRDRRSIYAERVARAGLAPPDEQTMHLLWQIVDEGVLGASNHVRLTQALFAHLLHSVGDIAEAWSRVRLAAEFVAETRGAEAPVVGNAIRMMIAGLDTEPADRRPAALQARIDRWQAGAAERLRRLVDTAVATIGPGRTIVAFDYSSTVASIVTALARRALPERVVVPESRAIAGGRRYIQAFAEDRIATHFVPDAAFEYILCDNAVVLLGAECVRCDGSLTNTLGSLPLARLANWRRCPVYGCADLLKLDTRGGAGAGAPAIRRFDDLLDGVALPEGAIVITDAPELEIVPPDLITGFLTERGLVLPEAMGALGREVFGSATEPGDT